ncbi:alpha-1A adrenergic receptor-like [Salarias fasciatus]|uniref:alpha-1A adrenergic receptor-like n=1 Tax=Salarias fasciatus TaxID=181472 RepID=UPI00117650FF|nr:alpha-1A adrenergic receptor-like [Salarias fasciatus]
MRRTPTPAWDFENGTVWEEYVDTAFVVANSLILLITSVVGIAANVFVVLAVYHQKSLQTSNNALVVNLAVVDFLRCGIDCPILLAIVMTVYRRGRVDDLICDTHIVSFSFSCCIQLLTLACISAERHQAIAQPFKASQRKTRIMVLIPLTWILAVLMAVLCLMYLRDSPVHARCKGQQREKLPSYDNFGLFMLFPLWAACFGVITGFYARILALVKSHNRKIFDEGTFPLSKKDPAEEERKREETTVVENAKHEKNRGASLPPVSETEAVKPPVEVEGAVCMMPSKAGKERASKKKESKMAKRAGYIIVTFLLFWLPLITTILVNVVSDKNKNAQTLIIQDLEILSVSVACITSLSDPIIYAAVNPQFRTEFYRLKNRLSSVFSKKF